MVEAKETVVDGQQALVPGDDDGSAVQAIKAFTLYHDEHAPLPTNDDEAKAALAVRKTLKPYYTATKLSPSTYQITLVDQSSGIETASAVVSTEEAGEEEEEEEQEETVNQEVGPVAAATAATPGTTGTDEAEDVQAKNGTVTDDTTATNQDDSHGAEAGAAGAAGLAAFRSKGTPHPQSTETTTKPATETKNAVASQSSEPSKPTTEDVKDKAQSKADEVKVQAQTAIDEGKAQGKETAEDLKAQAKTAAEDGKARGRETAAKAKGETPANGATGTKAKEGKPKKQKKGLLGLFKSKGGTNASSKPATKPSAKDAAPAAAAVSKTPAIKAEPKPKEEKKEAKKDEPPPPPVYTGDKRFEPNVLAPSRVAERERRIKPLNAEERKALREKEEAEAESRKKEQAKATPAAPAAQPKEVATKGKDEATTAGAATVAPAGKAKEAESKAEEATTDAKQAATKPAEASPATKEVNAAQPTAAVAGAVPTGAAAEPAVAGDARSDATWSSAGDAADEGEADVPFAPIVTPKGRFTTVDDPSAPTEPTEAHAQPEGEVQVEPQVAATTAEAAKEGEAVPATEHTTEPKDLTADVPFAPAVVPQGRFASVEATSPALTEQPELKKEVVGVPKKSVESNLEAESLAAGTTAAETKNAPAPEEVRKDTEVVPNKSTETAAPAEPKSRFGWLRRSKPSGGEAPTKVEPATAATAAGATTEDEARHAEGSASEEDQRADADGLVDDAHRTEESEEEAPIAYTSRLREHLSSTGWEAGVSEENRAALRTGTTDKETTKRLTGLQKQSAAEEKAAEAEEKKRATEAQRSTASQRLALESFGDAARDSAANQARREAEAKKNAQKAKEREAKQAKDKEKKERQAALRKLKQQRKAVEGKAQAEATEDLRKWQAKQAKLERERLAAVKAQRAALDESFTPERAAEAATNPAVHYDVWRQEHPLTHKPTTTRSHPHDPTTEEKPNVNSYRRVANVNPDSPLSRSYVLHTNGKDEDKKSVSIADRSNKPVTRTGLTEVTVVNPPRGRGIPAPGVQWRNAGAW